MQTTRLFSNQAICFWEALTASCCRTINSMTQSDPASLCNTYTPIIPATVPLSTDGLKTHTHGKPFQLGDTVSWWLINTAPIKVCRLPSSRFEQTNISIEFFKCMRNTWSTTSEVLVHFHYTQVFSLGH